MCSIQTNRNLCHIASNLIKGDKVHVGGGVRPASKNFPRVINVEFIKILHLEKSFSFTNPFCIKCKKKK